MRRIVGSLAVAAWLTGCAAPPSAPPPASSPVAPSSQTTWDVYQGFGLTGTWAIHCDQLAATTNPWMEIYVEDGRVNRRLMMGDGMPHYSIIEQARTVTPTTLETRWRNAAGWTGASADLASDLVIVKERGQVRTLQSKGSDGKDYIKDGRLTANNAPAPWMEKCSK